VPLNKEMERKESLGKFYRYQMVKIVMSGSGYLTSGIGI
jgi:hypothetical protein